MGQHQACTLVTTSDDEPTSFTSVRKKAGSPKANLLTRDNYYG
jgi:hypothetical protein